jgi:hypothetical protein
MTIEITRPEVEALIQQRLQSGGFSDAEDMIFQALRSSEPAVGTAPEARRKFDNLADLLLNSSFAGANLDLSRSEDYPRVVEIE